ncbi:hypothetical protein HK405_007430, partial [Cladochytrium tenue]
MAVASEHAIQELLAALCMRAKAPNITSSSSSVNGEQLSFQVIGVQRQDIFSKHTIDLVAST